MLKEHKTKKTPITEKKSKVVLMKKRSLVIFERILPIALNGVFRKAENGEDTPESLKVELKNVTIATAAISIDAAAAFEDTWKKKKGMFLAD